jgi:hypothetical protein
MLDPRLRQIEQAKAFRPPPAPPTVNVVVQTPQWSKGVAMILSLFIPGLGQIYKGQLFNGFLWSFLVLVGYVSSPFLWLIVKVNLLGGLDIKGDSDITLPLFLLLGPILHLLCIIGAGMGDPYRRGPR